MGNKEDKRIEMNDEGIMREFNHLGSIASYHFADESRTSTWERGYIYQDKAMDLFFAFPKLQEKMRVCRFLWSVKSEEENILRKKGLLEEPKNPCKLCGKMTAWSVGRAGLRWKLICQKCKDEEDEVLAKNIEMMGCINERLGL